MQVHGPLLHEHAVARDGPNLRFESLVQLDVLQLHTAHLEGCDGVLGLGARQPRELTRREGVLARGVDDLAHGGGVEPKRELLAAQVGGLQLACVAAAGEDVALAILRVRPLVEAHQQLLELLVVGI